MNEIEVTAGSSVDRSVAEVAGCSATESGVTRAECGERTTSTAVAIVSEPDPETAIVRSAARSEDPIVRNLMKSYFDWEDTFRVHPSELATLEACTTYLEALVGSTRLTQSPYDLFDRGKSTKAYREGMALTQVRPLPQNTAAGEVTQRPRMLLPLKPDGMRMGWKEWLGQFGISEATAYWRRKYFDLYPTLAVAIAVGYDETMKQLIPSYRKKYDAEFHANDVNDGDANAENDDDDEDSADGGDGGDSHPTHHGAKYSLSQARDDLQKSMGRLTRFAERIGNTTEAINNPQSTPLALAALEKEIDELKRGVRRADTALHDAVLSLTKQTHDMLARGYAIRLAGDPEGEEI